MTTALAVTAPGLNVTVQDLGRPGFQAIGVPTGGALDPIMLRLANWLVGNGDGEGALEMRFSGPAFELRGGEAQLALAGDGADIELLPPFEGRCPGWRSMTMRPGQRFRVVLKGGGPCYLAVGGGFAIPPVLGSVSTLAVSGIGGFQGRALKAGDVLPLRLARPALEADQALRAPKFASPAAIRVMLGPQDGHFTQAGLRRFLSEPFTISHLSDRMGLRLEGRPVEHVGGFDLISDGNAPGAIQVPGSGCPIVLMADRGTTGGYPKIATVISADLPVLGRLPPGSELRFQAVTHAQAVEALRAQDAMLAGLKASVARYRDPGEELARALLEENIISGVSDAQA
jgi:biotin-dependent carboxylase-like uncharacterized protein